ncbi:uncharacterized protein MONOS_17007 [Monocercomonoides exilis]|uniref:uncharacterized protein n=1 Tax=Monocercomonoides exilis TaxID=2049356 RepID=UPI003559FD3C|nr:hypothetical protein MONOS_17007 [Monocercomonoides exilis]
MTNNVNYTKIENLILPFSDLSSFFLLIRTLKKTKNPLESETCLLKLLDLYTFDLVPENHVFNHDLIETLCFHMKNPLSSKDSIYSSDLLHMIASYKSLISKSFDYSQITTSLTVLIQCKYEDTSTAATKILCYLIREKQDAEASLSMSGILPEIFALLNDQHLADEDLQQLLECITVIFQNYKCKANCKVFVEILTKIASSHPNLTQKIKDLLTLLKDQT